MCLHFPTAPPLHFPTELQLPQGGFHQVPLQPGPSWSGQPPLLVRRCLAASLATDPSPPARPTTTFQTLAGQPNSSLTCEDLQASWRESGQPAIQLLLTSSSPSFPLCKYMAGTARASHLAGHSNFNSQITNAYGNELSDIVQQ